MDKNNPTHSLQNDAARQKLREYIRMLEDDLIFFPSYDNDPADPTEPENNFDDECREYLLKRVHKQQLNLNGFPPPTH